MPLHSYYNQNITDAVMPDGKSQIVQSGGTIDTVAGIRLFH
jgi:hypothetical protein